MSTMIIFVFLSLMQPPSLAITTNIDTLLGATEGEMTQPNETVQDKVHFIFNNISASNLKQKVFIIILLSVTANCLIASKSVIIIIYQFHFSFSIFKRLCSFLTLSPKIWYKMRIPKDPGKPWETIDLSAQLKEFFWMSITLNCSWKF